MEKYAYGFPRLGKGREYKKIIEDFWSDKISEDELWQGLDKLENERLITYKKYVDKFPIGETTLYDKMLDMALLLGLYRCRNIKEYFSFCRGKKALEMTKWFNTNYHYLVPEIKKLPNKFKSRVIWNRLNKFRDGNSEGVPSIIGPFTFLKLAKGYEPAEFAEYLLKLGKLYKELIKNCDEIQIDEPAFVLELTKEEIDLIKKVYAELAEAKTDIYLFTYYDSVDFLPELYQLPVKAIGLDFVHGRENLMNIEKIGFPEDKILIAGLVDGRNVWRTDIFKAVEILKKLSKYAKNLMISNAGPLYHLPVTVGGEELNKILLNKLAFATERLYELDLIVKAYEGQPEEAREWVKDINTSFGVNKSVRERVNRLKNEDFIKSLVYQERAKIQEKVLNLPLFPTTTIGSFPQTEEVRKTRADFRAGRISQEEYEAFLKKEISALIKVQDEFGLDVLVHGEFERTDMVEFFAEKLIGMATTKKGWIISYGNRVYRPPIIYGDIFRPQPMTIKEIAFAQGLTKKPVKGMLTGPVTMIGWSFVREDIQIFEVAYQIALCLQDEIKDYEASGIKIVQIDEPAFREKAPLKKRNQNQYFTWAVKSFRLATQSKPETQIHTHMCYSELGEIFEKIMEMDFDVISLEAARSKGDIIKVFKKMNFDRQIGLGVWDIHSPIVPKIKDMREIIKKIIQVIPKEQIWVNPDCGLKTRGWEETITGLKNLVKVAKKIRKKSH